MRRQCLELRRSGLTYEEIGSRLGITRQGAHKHVKRALEQLAATTAEDASALRTLELLRLDRYLAGLDTSATNGDVGAVHAALKLAERRAKLLGLDAPTKQELTGKDGGPLATETTVKPDLSKLTDEELDTMLRLLAKAKGETVET
jgi:hypothetical protein